MAARTQQQVPEDELSTTCTQRGGTGVVPLGGTGAGLQREVHGDKCGAPQVQWTAGAPHHMGTSLEPRGRRSYLTKGPRAPTTPSANPIPSANDDVADSERSLLIGAQDLSSIPLARKGHELRGK